MICKDLFLKAIPNIVFVELKLCMMFVICKDLFLKAIPNGPAPNARTHCDVCDMQRPLFESKSKTSLYGRTAEGVPILMQRYGEVGKRARIEDEKDVRKSRTGASCRVLRVAFLLHIFPICGMICRKSRSKMNISASYMRPLCGKYVTLQR